MTPTPPDLPAAAVPPRDALDFPFAAAGWCLLASLPPAGWGLFTMLRGMLGHDLPIGSITPVLAGWLGNTLQGLLTAAVLVMLVARWRQGADPGRVGHAPWSAALTGVLAALVAWVLTSAAWAATAYWVGLDDATHYLAMVQVIEYVHPLGIVIGALVGVAASMGRGTAAAPASPTRHALAGLAVFAVAVTEGMRLLVGVGMLALVASEGSYSAVEHSQSAAAGILLVVLGAMGGFALVQAGRIVPARGLTGYAVAGALCAPALMLAGAAALVAIVLATYGMSTGLDESTVMLLAASVVMLPALPVGALAAWLLLRGRRRA